MRKVCREYAAIFDEIEENPSCTIQWNVADCAVISKPQLIPLDRRNRVHQDAVKSEESLNAELRFPLMHKDSDKELQPASSRLNNTGNGLELSINEPEMLLQQSHAVSTCQRTDLPRASVGQNDSGLHQDMHIVDDCQNFEHISADCAKDNHDSVAVVSNEVLSENEQAPSTVALGGSTLQEQRHNLALELLWVQQAIHSRKQVWLLCG